MNDVHALAKLCCYREEARSGDQPLKNAWRIRGTFPKWLGSLCTQPALSGSGAPLPWAPGPPAARPAPLLLRPPSFRFGRPLAIGRKSLPARPPPRAAPPLTPPALPPAEILGMVGGGGGARRPSAGLRAARNALKRREERARAGAQASGSGERGRAEAAGGREKERVRASRERRGAGEPGTRSARTFLQSANFPGECRARLLGLGHSQREFEILGKRVGLPPSPFPFYESPLKRKQE